MKRLKWIGPEGEYLPGIPASDFDCEDDKQAEELVKAGLYEYADAPAAKSEERRVKSETAGAGKGGDS